VVADQAPATGEFSGCGEKEVGGSTPSTALDQSSNSLPLRRLRGLDWIYLSGFHYPETIVVVDGGRAAGDKLLAHAAESDGTDLLFGKDSGSSKKKSVRKSRMQ
jgi:hypothetical protein